MAHGLLSGQFCNSTGLLESIGVTVDEGDAEGIGLLLEEFGLCATFTPLDQTYFFPDF